MPMNNNPKLNELKQKANRLPLTPGVYIMKDKDGVIIYIGKAKQLKNRVTQYFGTGNQHNEKVKKMVSNVDRFEYILCDTEFEAFILENSLIKQNQPKYNILLKDDKGFHYVKITEPPYRRIEYANIKGNDGKYIGPYNSGYAVKNIVDEARKIFKLPDCSRNFDKPSKPCLNYHIGLCDAPCKGKMSKSEYDENVDAAINFIKKGGYNAEELNLLRQKMERAAENLEFEYAAKLRDRISAIEKMSAKQKVIACGYKEQDVFAIAEADGISCVEIINFRNGRLCDQSNYFFERMTRKNELYSDFLQSYYNNKEKIPNRIVLYEECADAEILEKWLSEKSGHKVNIVLPQKGETKELADMCLKNAADNLSRRLERNGREVTALNELAELLGLSKTPSYIESYDISNTAGSENVAGMIVFYNARPLKSNYRRFKIKTFEGQDDYRSMAEVIDRRFTEYEKQSDDAFSRLPDLILLDGGKGQVSAVSEILEKHSITVPLFGMVKDSKHRTRAITAGGADINIKSTRKVYTLVTEIQDEVHRYAIGYHRQSRTKTMLNSEVLSIDGIGEKKAKILLKKFKTLTRLKAATYEELIATDGITSKNAESIVKHFNE